MYEPLLRVARHALMRSDTGYTLFTSEHLFLLFSFSVFHFLVVVPCGRLS